MTMNPMFQNTRDMERGIPVSTKEDDGEEENYTCRICLEDNCLRKDLIAPCACKGGSKWVHRECLDRWRSVREDKAFSKCTECLQFYQLICVTNDTCEEQCTRRTRFSLFVCKDLLLMLFLTQLVVVILALIVYGCDKHTSYLLHLFKMENYPRTFYYCMGLFLSFSLTGMLGSCIRSEVCGDCRACDNCYCNDIYFFPYYIGPADTSPCCACCPGESAGGGAAGCLECGTCGSCDCNACLVGAGEEMIYFLVIALVLFAILGFFIFIAMGIYYVQQITRKHIHILEKWNLTKEYIVKDLAPDALPMTPAMVQHIYHGNEELNMNNGGDYRPSAPQLIPGDVEGQIELNPMRIASAPPLSSMVMDRSEGNYARQRTPLLEFEESMEGENHHQHSFQESGYSSSVMTMLAPNRREELIARGLL